MAFNGKNYYVPGSESHNGGVFNSNQADFSFTIYILEK